MKDWKTTVVALVPLAAYALNFFHLWPASIPLPPFDQIWPTLLAVVGVGAAAADTSKE